MMISIYLEAVRCLVNLPPSPFPLPRGERIEVRGKRKFLYY